MQTKLENLIVKDICKTNFTSRRGNDVDQTSFGDDMGPVRIQMKGTTVEVL